MTQKALGKEDLVLPHRLVMRPCTAKACGGRQLSISPNLHSNEPSLRFLPENTCLNLCRALNLFCEVGFGSLISSLIQGREATPSPCTPRERAAGLAGICRSWCSRRARRPCARCRAPTRASAWSRVSAWWPSGTPSASGEQRCCTLWSRASAWWPSGTPSGSGPSSNSDAPPAVLMGKPRSVQAHRKHA